MSEFSDLLAVTRLEQLLRLDLPEHDSDGDPVNVRQAVANLLEHPGVTSSWSPRRQQVVVTLDLADTVARAESTPDPEPAEPPAGGE